MIVELVGLLVPEHLGKLHPFEQALVLVLAFGPILLLAVTIRIARKRAFAADEQDGPPQAGGPDPSDPTGRGPRLNG